MSIIEINTPDGKVLEVNAPDNATPAQIHQAAMAAANHYNQNVLPVEKTSKLRQAYNLAKIPEQMVSQILSPGELKSPEPEISPSIPKTLISGAPRVMEETAKTIIGAITPKDYKPTPTEKLGADIISGFVSPESLATMGTFKAIKTMKPLIKGAGNLTAKGLEALSGLEHKTPGILTEAATSPKILFGPGSQAAEPLYEAGKKIGGKLPELMTKIDEKKAFVNEALKLAESGKLNPTTALEARKELVAIKKNIPGEFYRNSKKILNEIAKPVFGMADKAHEAGLKSEAIRNFLPLNKSGGASTFKTMLGATLKGIGSLGVMSPIVQGTAATAAGATARALAPIINNPITSGAITGSALKLLSKNPDIAIGAEETIGKDNNQQNNDKSGQDLESKQKPELEPLKKKLSADKAREFLRQAKGNKDKARKLAIDAGYDLNK